MGWWKVEGTEHVVGDDPLDALGGAVADILAAYESEFARKPTKAEWEVLLLAVLGERDGTESPIAQDGVIERVTIDGD
jgi:hypothetical protein